MVDNVIILLLIFMAIGLMGIAHIRQIPKINIAVPIVFGKRLRRIYSEGLGFVLNPFTKMDVYSIEKETRKIPIENLFTPEDHAEIVVVCEITTKIGCIPGEENGEKSIANVFDYIETVNPMSQLEAVIAEQVRVFIQDKNEKPRNWNEAIAMSDKIARIITAKILGQAIPTYDKKLIESLKEEGRMSEEEASKIVLGSHVSEEHMTSEEKERKRTTKEIYNNLKVGNGSLAVPGLGIMITRLNITEVKPSEKLQKALEKISAEEKEQISEQIEMETLLKLVKNFAIGLFLPSNFEILPVEEKKVFLEEAEKLAREKYFSSPEEIFTLMRKFQYERGKIVGKAEEYVLSVDSGRELLGNIASSLFEKYFKKEE